MATRDDPLRTADDIFSPVSTGRISEEIVDQIKGAILDGPPRD